MYEGWDEVMYEKSFIVMVYGFDKSFANIVDLSQKNKSKIMHN
jgi:hypothetical protein